MPKITDILTQHNIDRQALSDAYKATFGKALTSRSVQIKDEERTQLAPKFAKNQPTSKAHDDNESKVFKAEEVSFGDDFLSGLGFGPKHDEVEATSDAKDDEIDVFATKGVEKTTEEEERTSFGNARVISSAPERPKFEKRQAAPAPQPAGDRKPADSETRGKTFHKFSSNGPTFSKGVAKPQAARPTSTGTSHAPSHGGYHNANRGSKHGHTATTNAQHNPVAQIKKEAATSDTLIKKQEIILGDSVSVKEFSEKM